jgi:hypothetical protein
LDWDSTCVFFPLKFLPFLIAATIFFSISLIVVGVFEFDADNIRFSFRLSFCVNVVFSFVQTSPDFIWCLVVCCFLVAFVGCEPFLLSGGVLYWFCC